jgi:predicted DNA-binding transcriptional regulator YafY
MNRAQRLLEILDILRQSKMPVTALSLSERLGITTRSVYRDILSLREGGAEIDGDPGLGYTIRAGTFLPPMSFTRDEAEALALGLRWVASGPDIELGEAAKSAKYKLIDKISDATARSRLDRNELLTPNLRTVDFSINVSDLRKTISRERKIVLTYVDKKFARTTRKVWPIVIGYFPHALVLVAWCELRMDFRSFRIDRIMKFEATDEVLPERIFSLQKRWCESENISP